MGKSEQKPGNPRKLKRIKVSDKLKRQKGCWEGFSPTHSEPNTSILVSSNQFFRPTFHEIVKRFADMRGNRAIMRDESQIMRINLSEWMGGKIHPSRSCLTHSSNINDQSTHDFSPL